eukprot:gene18740-25270_t
MTATYSLAVASKFTPFIPLILRNTPMFPSPSPVRKKNLKRAAPCPVLGSGEPCIGSLTTARIATSIAPPSQNAPPVRKQSELAEQEYWKPYMPPCVQVSYFKYGPMDLG